MISLRIRAALAATALAVLTVPTPAQARPATPPSQLRLTLRDDGSGATRAVALRCEPTDGDHPRAREACEALAPAGGDPEALTGTPGVFCNHLYQPVTASAEGSWRGSPVRWRHSFANPCGLHTRTGPVFRF
ncbi:hypothetical protein GCM10009665_35260 [Kitasatospora nipponensis]|uniref:Subtilisin inhibitor domain-containing protein n=1 Tax=Kitasatospora nipponensis TaxID=258049 RepID=A0ABN1WA11_9ACTN